MSYRKTSSLLQDVENFSHEAVRQWHRRCRGLFLVEKVWRRAVAIDETQVKLENRQIYIGNAIDIDRKTILLVHVSTTRTSLQTPFFVPGRFWIHVTITP